LFFDIKRGEESKNKKGLLYMKKSLFMSFLLLCGVATFVHAIGPKKGIPRSTSFSKGNCSTSEERSRIPSVLSLAELVRNNKKNGVSRSTSMGQCHHMSILLNKKLM
jgi:hypothetical protein